MTQHSPFTRWLMRQKNSHIYAVLTLATLAFWIGLIAFIIHFLR